MPWTPENSGENIIELASWKLCSAFFDGFTLSLSLSLPLSLSIYIYIYIN